LSPRTSKSTLFGSSGQNGRVALDAEASFFSPLSNGATLFRNLLVDLPSRFFKNRQPKVLISLALFFSVKCHDGSHCIFWLFKFFSTPSCSLSKTTPASTLSASSPGSAAVFRPISFSPCEVLVQGLHRLELRKGQSTEMAVRFSMVEPTIFPVSSSLY